MVKRAWRAVLLRRESQFSVILAAVWMVFLYYPATALGDGVPLVGVVVGWTALILFAVVYLFLFALMGRDGPGRGPARPFLIGFAVELALVAVFVPLIGTGVLSFTPFLCALAVFTLPVLAAVAVVVGTAVGVLVTMVATGQEWLSLLINVGAIVLIGTITRWFIRRAAEADTLAIGKAVAEERETVARDVHDLLGHSLTLIKLKAELAQRLVERDPERAARELAQISAVASESLAGVRTTVNGLRVGLDAQLAQSRHALASAGVRLETTGSAEVLSPAQNVPVAWILRECTTNTIRHARATRAEVSFEPGRFRFDDDGTGLVRSGDGGRQATDGNGFAGMRERAAVAGALLRVAESPLGGVRVEASW
ncbi:sensor histidine kinase [Mycetocola reblochoni]|uniref:Sensor histidine kinase n=2 Tax=Mycetocola reblochoni TaxID=331618 RepID=A0A1R4K3H5_9MICO|nr:histidine kinase [Mycetocola reblochoni]RLP68228.1 sensor histidine kinase [Mycetocola reblochoni]SJN38786.1 sensor histidine kinase [Mycetocola reblochoni REB411]